MKPGRAGVLQMVGAASALLAAGALLAWWTVARADRDMRSELLRHAVLVSQALDLSDIRALSGDETDLTRPEYQRVKDRLTRVEQADPACRFVYITGRRPDGSLFFFADSEPPESDDYSPPGQTYPEATEDLRHVFVSGVGMVEGPVVDRWGVWVSSRATLRDPETGDVFAVLGMDINAGTWRRSLAARAALPVGLFLALVCLAFLALLALRSRAELRDNAVRHQVLFAASPDAYLILADGVITDCNRAAEVLFRGTRGMIAGKRPEDLSPDFQSGGKPSAVAAVETIDRATRSGGVFFEWMHRRFDGSVFQSEVALSVMTIQGRQMLFAAVRDVSRRKETEQALYESRAMLDLVVDTIPQSVFWKDRSGRYLGCNRAFASAVGLSNHAEIIGKTDFDLPWSREEAEAYRMDDLEVIDNNRPKLHFEEPLRQADGSRLWIDTSKVPLTDESGRAFAVLGVYEDITKKKKAEEATRLSQERLDLAMDAANSGLWDWDVAGDTVYFDPRYFTMAGYAPDAFPHNFSEWEKRVHPDDLTECQEALGAYLSGQAPHFNIEFRFLRQDETWMWIRGHGKAVAHDAEGKVTRVVGTHTDITERKLAEEALRKSEELLDATGAMAHVGGWELDARTMRVVWTRETHRIHGVPPETEPALDNALDFYRPEDRPRIKAAVRRAIDDAEPYDLELSIITTAGNTVYARVIGSPVIENGRVVKVRGAFQDITGRKQAEIELDRSRRMLREVIDAIPIRVFWKDPDGTFLGCNEAFAADAGKQSPDEVVGRSDFDMPWNDRAAQYQAEDRQVIESKAPKLNHEEGRTGPDGRLECWLRVSKTPLSDAGGHVYGVLGIYEDITEHKLAEIELAESRRILHDVIDTIPVRVFWKDLDGRYLGCNTLFARDAGRTDPEGVVGCDDYGVGWSDQAGLYRADDRLVIESDRPKLNYEEPQTTPDGRQVWLRTSKIPLRDSGARVYGILGVYEDITERKRAEEALLESEERFSIAFMSSPAPLVLSEINTGVFIDVNDRWVEMLEFTREEQIGKTSKEVGIWADPADRDRIIGKFHAEGAFWDEPISFRTKSGKPIVALWSGVKVTLSRKQILLSMITDITARRLAEEALRESEEHNRALLNALPDIIFVLSRDGVFLEFRAPAGRPLRMSPEQVIGKRVDQVLPPDLAALVMSRIEQAFETGVMQVYTYTLRIQDTDHFMETRMVIKGEREVLLIERDISDHKRAEEERERLQAQLLQAQKMESVGRLAGGVAHDFNNMLGVILGYTGMALNQLDPGDRLHGHMIEVSKAAQRSADLTRQLLAFARRQTVAPRVLDLNETVASMLKILGRLIGEDIELVWKPAGGLDAIRMDPAQIDQMLANLVVNARDAIGLSGGRVTIETGNARFDEAYCAAHPGFTPGDFVLLAVSDNGCGMDAVTRENIFEPFFTTKEVGQGTGLGLATVYGIVKQNDGFVNVYSEPGQGSTFRIYLPAQRPDHESGADDQTDSRFPRGSETVLLVEDEPAILAMAKSMLGEMGYMVLAASHPDEALRLVAGHGGEIRLLVTDVVMPSMNGRELAELLAQSQPGIRCLYMSGYTADVIAHRGVLDEGVHFIQKPFSMQELGAMVREVLDS